MGVSISVNIDLSELSFIQKEYEFLRKKFNKYSNLIDGVPNQIIGPKGFQAMFKENKKFAKKLYYWIVSKSNNGVLDFNYFAMAIEIFIKENNIFSKYNVSFRNFEKSEMFGLIHITNKQYYGKEYDREFINRIEISFSQALTFFKSVINMFFKKKQFDDQYDFQNDIAAKIMTLGIYGSKSSLDFQQFFILLKEQFPELNNSIQTYFIYKFLDKSKRLLAPQFNEKSCIISQYQMPLFALQSPQIFQFNKMNLLYSNQQDVPLYQKIADILLTYKNSPTLILIRHVDQIDEIDDFIISKSLKPEKVGKEYYVFGLYSQASYKDFPASNGDQYNCIFSILPKFKAYNFKNGLGDRQFCTFKNKKINQVIDEQFKTGIGYGTTINGKKRVWLDEDLQNKSYITPYDKTYEQGFILAPHIEKLNIDYIEIWGFENSIDQVQVIKKEIDEDIGCFMPQDNMKTSKDTQSQQTQVNIQSTRTKQIEIIEQSIVSKTYVPEKIQVYFNQQDFRQSSPPVTQNQNILE